MSSRLQNVELRVSVRLVNDNFMWCPQVTIVFFFKIKNSYMYYYVFYLKSKKINVNSILNNLSNLKQ